MRAPITGFIVYEGPSQINGEPIVCIATIKTENKKTGNVIQTWILPADIDPVAAVQTDKNDSVCGGCPLQGKMIAGKLVNRVCYVNLGQAPLGVYEKYKRGGYPHYDRRLHEHFLDGRKVRFGSYGDPAAVPYKLIKYLAARSSGFLGYSHQLFSMPKRRADQLARYCMASCHTPAMRDAAQRRGWRTFTVVTDKIWADDDDLECLSDSHGISCEQCGLCNGTSGGARSIYILAHAKVGANLGAHQ